MNYAKHVNSRTIPVSQPLPGKAMIQNEAGGYVFQVSDADLVKRFLLLGSASGSYYSGEAELTREAAAAVIREIKRDGFGVVDTIYDVSSKGRAHKQQPALFALALCMVEGDALVKRGAILRIPDICRTATQLFTLLDYVKQLRGFGPAVKKGFQRWLTMQTPEQLAYQAVKYRSREGWSWPDFLRQVHPDPRLSPHAALYRWIMRDTNSKWLTEQDAEIPDFRVIKGFELVQAETNAKAAAKIVSEYRLTHEMIPSELRKSPEVWEALLDGMPYQALIRNLVTLARVGLLIPGNAKISSQVVQKLLSTEAILNSKIHPLAILIAAKIYGAGASGALWDREDRERLTWDPDGAVLDALTDAFYMAFQNLPSTGQRLLVSVDCSGSMGMGLGDVPLQAREAAAALALAYAHSEPAASFVGFATKLVPLDISKRQRLDDVLSRVDSLWSDGTDCSVPIKYALTNDLPFDAFVILTDSQDWAGNQHVSVALEQYRRKMNIPAKLVVVQMVFNKSTIADPDDPMSLNVVGFDGSTPAAITSFLTL